MRVGLDVLRRYVAVPEDPAETRRLLDEQGLEVKRVETDEVGTVFNLELLANRGDHHCYEGIARELDGRLGTGLTKPTFAELTVGDSPIELKLETELCTRYTATRLVKRGDGELPAEAQRLLQAAGLNPVGPAVDATNIANLEWGQPTHAFDADTIVGPITIRTSRSGEQAWPLFAEAKVTLPEGTVVIADDEKILAIAGVIGCEESRTTDSTTTLLLESATFDPVAVRIASRALQIFTDSSARFERGADHERPLVGAGRVVELLQQAGWEVEGTTGEVVGALPAPRQLTLSLADAQHFLGTDESATGLGDRLRRYGFGVSIADETLEVDVPSWRLPDVHHEADLLEELAKSIGYDQTPIELPPVQMGAQPSDWELRRDRVEQALLGQGFYEVFTDGFYGRKVFEQLGIAEDHPLFAHVETQNALDRAYSLLKNNALHQALEAAVVNERRRTLAGQMFEWTRTFHPTGVLNAADTPPHEAAAPCTERSLMWAMSFGERQGQALDARFLVGVVREIATETGLALTVEALDAAHPLASFLHPGRAGVVHLDGETVGVLGEVHPAVLKRYKIKRIRPCYLEIEQAALAGPGMRPTFVEPAVHQPIVRTVALAVPPPTPAGDVRAAFLADAPEGLSFVDVVDVFVGEEDGSQVRSITFELSYSNDDNQRTADDVNQMTETLVAAVLKRFTAVGVHRR
ncbi:MAG: phenylalanine--tRNA ligase subunit beta [Myxococcota bacterium]